MESDSPAWAGISSAVNKRGMADALHGRSLPTHDPERLTDPFEQVHAAKQMLEIRGRNATGFPVTESSLFVAFPQRLRAAPNAHGLRFARTRAISSSTLGRILA